MEYAGAIRGARIGPERRKGRGCPGLFVFRGVGESWRGSRFGFTLVEIIVVLLLMAIVSAVAATKLVSNNNAVLAEAALIKSHLRFAQALALASTNRWGFAFSGSSYVLQCNDSPAGLSLPSNNGSTRTLPRGITVNNLTVSFDNWGNPGTNTLLVSLNSGIETITITKNTGYVP